jgi:Na+-translocating ferredoxin:NAD+ oxidoreductase subunit G
MAKLESTFKNMLIVLTVISLIAAVSLASMYNLTKGPIDQATAKKSQEAIKMVLPAFDKLEDVASADGLVIHKAYAKDGSFVGAAVEGKAAGFSGDVKVMVGFDKEGNIVDYSVLQQTETPGLGTKMVDWFKPAKEVQKSLVETVFGFQVKPVEKQSSIIGKNPAKNNLTVSKDGGEIDAITASTISSRSFLLAISEAYKAYAAANDMSADTQTGATQASEKGENHE